MNSNRFFLLALFSVNFKLELRFGLKAEGQVKQSLIILIHKNCLNWYQHDDKTQIKNQLINVKLSPYCLWSLAWSMIVMSICCWQTFSAGTNWDHFPSTSFPKHECYKLSDDEMKIRNLVFASWNWCLILLCHTMGDLDLDDLSTIKEIISWKHFPKESILSFSSTGNSAKKLGESEENVRSIRSVTDCYLFVFMK